jgi:predicted Rdx family selenoprotein
LAAAIKENFGLTPTLVEGHGGIFEVAVKGHLVYSNQKAGGRFPDNDAIFREIRKYKTTLGGTEVKEQSPPSEIAAPSCKWPS